MSIVEKSMQPLRARALELAAAPSASETVAAVLTAPVGRPAVPRGDLGPLKWDESSGREAGFDLSQTHGGQFHSQIRALRRRVLDLTQPRRDARQAPLILVTSATPGDGKSFVAFHLAMSLTAERNLEVTLIDCDITRPRISSLFTGSDDAGLSGALETEMPLATVIRRTTVPRLAVVRAGANMPAASETLTSSRWDDRVAEIRAAGSSRIFIADTAPVLATAEAQYLARTADLVLFVVRAEVTPRRAVAEALARLRDVSRIAFVFNGHVRMGTDFYYDYGSYYGGQDNAKTIGKRT